MDEYKRILTLRNELHRYNYLYYVKNMPEISDRQFDELMNELIHLEKLHPEYFDANSPTQRVGSDINNDFTQVVHRYPMLSLSNTYNLDEVQAFYERVETGLGNEPFEICCELKFDGLSISLQYEKGRLTRAVTRGDGIQGDDVTANIRTIQSIPLQLSGDQYPDEFEIRGEVLMPWKSFEALNAEREANEEPLFANPRNAASGTLKSKNSTVVAKRKLDAYLYYLLGPSIPGDSHYDNMKTAASWGFKVSEHMRNVRSLNEIKEFIEYWDTERKNLPVATDGIVLKVNSLRQQNILGYTAKSPRWAIAYKFQAERARTRLLQVTYQVGRTGSITPVANMNPVQLAGTIVKRASLHNEDIIRQLDLHIGEWVYVEKAGEIIPQIVGVDKEGRDAQLGAPVRFITHCPECGTPLIRLEGEAAYYCPNETACPPQLKGRIEHFISRDAMNIDSLGHETIESYYNQGLIHDAADLYNLRVEDISGDNGTRERSARKIIENIRKSTEVPFERVLYALGIRLVGKAVAKILARHFKTLEKLQDAPLEEMLEVEGVGEMIARNVRSFFQEQRNLDFIERLRAAGIQMAVSSEGEKQSDLLNGKKIVISGVFIQHSRDEYKQMIERHGGKNVGSISAQTSFILAGNSMGPSKLEKANRLNIPLVDEETFLKMIESDEREGDTSL